MNYTATFLSVEEAAALLRVHPRTILRRVADGTIRSVRLGKTIRIPHEQFATRLVIPTGTEQFPTGISLKESTASPCHVSHTPWQEGASTPTPKT